MRAARGLNLDFDTLERHDTGYVSKASEVDDWIAVDLIKNLLANQISNDAKEKSSNTLRHLMRDKSFPSTQRKIQLRSDQRMKTLCSITDGDAWSMLIEKAF